MRPAPHDPGHGGHQVVVLATLAGLIEVPRRPVRTWPDPLFAPPAVSVGESSAEHVGKVPAFSRNSSDTGLTSLTIILAS